MRQTGPIPHKVLDYDHFREFLRRLPTHRDFDQEKSAADCVTECMFCGYYVPLIGTFSEDSGGCTNPNSPCDGRVKFEHDGCEAFIASKRWVHFQQEFGDEP